MLAQGPQVEMSTTLPTSGVAFSVRALDDRGAGVPGASLVVLDASDTHAAEVVTSDKGIAQIVLPHPGAYVLTWHGARGFDVLVPFHVVEARNTWGLAVWTVPLGEVLGWIALRSRRRPFP